MRQREIGKEIVDYFDRLVFREDVHEYNVGPKKFPSVSGFIKNFTKPFEEEKIAPYSAKKEGVTVEEILKKWKDIREEACTLGTRVHDFGERYAVEKYNLYSNLHYSSVYQHLKIGEELLPKSKAVIKFWRDMPNYMMPVAMELRMFCEVMGLAGTADIILLDTRTNTLVIADYKTNKDLFKQYKDQKLLGIFKAWDDCPYSKYTIQLSAYQILLELTGYKVSRRFLVWLKEDGNYEIYNTKDVTKEINQYYQDKREYANW